MSHLINKKGFSDLIQIVLLVALSIIAIVAIGSYVIDLAKIEKLSPAVDCLTQKIKIANACINEQGQIELRVSPDIGQKVLSARFSVGNKLFACGENSCSTCSFIEQSQQTIFLEPAQQIPDNTELIASFNGCSVTQKIIISQC